MVHIRLITEENKGDIRLPNEPFTLFGRMRPSYQDGEWRYTTEPLPAPQQEHYPEEGYDYDKMKADHVAFAAYDGDACVGLAILRQEWHKYLYLLDLKVNSSYRRQGVGAMLMEKAGEYAVNAGYRGLWTIGQDTNLAACLFYIKNGFSIGGLDTRVYDGTGQAGTADIHFYKELL